MNKFKVLILTVMLCAMLVLSQPASTRVNAAETLPSVPVVVFIQDKNNRMLLKHNFDLDSKIYIPMDNGIDSGFYVTIPNAR